MFAFGIVLGALQAYKEGSKFDGVVSTFSMAGMSIPFYVIAILALLVFSYRLGWFPRRGPPIRASTTTGAWRSS